MRTPVPCWRLGVQRTSLWRAIVGEVPPVKRVLDVLGSVIACIVLSPVFFLIAAAIKLQDGGPILYWQTQVGKRGRCFAFPKFRSMVSNAETLQETLMHRNHHSQKSITFKDRTDPRITRVGRILRKLSLDELPQLWCVFKGDMSLVGPRPPLPREVDKYSPRDLRRLEVAPGLTCFWQVQGRGDLPFEQQVELDIAYIDQYSIWLDFSLLFRTVPAVLLGRGAY